MARSAWDEFNGPLGDGEWIELDPADPEFDHAYAWELIPANERPTDDEDGLPHCELFFGAQVGHSPSREGVASAPGKAEPALGKPCPVCGGLPSRAVCVACLRIGDHKIDRRANQLARVAAADLAARQALIDRVRARCAAEARKRGRPRKDASASPPVVE